MQHFRVQHRLSCGAVVLTASVRTYNLDDKADKIFLLRCSFLDSDGCVLKIVATAVDQFPKIFYSLATR